MDEHAKDRALGLGLVVAATACWSTSGVFINLIVANSGITPTGLAFWRDLGTFLCLFGGLALTKPELLRVKAYDLPWLIAMGALSIGMFHVLWNTSVVAIGASVATVIQSNAPVIVAVLAWVFWREPLTWRKIASIVLAGIGTALIYLIDQEGAVNVTPSGLAIALAAAVGYASFSLFGKKLSGSYSSWTILVYVFGVATVVLIPFALRSDVPWQAPPRVIAYLAGLVLLTTLSGFALYTIALGKLQASVAAITANTEILFASVLAYFLLGERLSVYQVLGALLIVGAVVLVSLRRRRSARAPLAAAEQGSQ